MDQMKMKQIFCEVPDVVVIPESQLDLRSDDEISEQLLRFQPVLSEKNIWTFWDTGYNDMRPYVKRFIIGWVRRLGREWTVRVLDHVERSPVNVNKFLDSIDLFTAFKDRTMTGPYVGAHSGDVVRLPLLYHYGGIWMDAGTMLFRHVDNICWKVLADPATPYEIAGFASGTNPDEDTRLDGFIAAEPGNDMIMNGFIAARKGNEFIKRWHAVFLEIWKGRTDCTGIQDHPLLRQVPKIRVPADIQEKFDIDNSLVNDYSAHFLAFKRARMTQDSTDGFDGPRYWEDHAFVLPVEETFLAQIFCKFNGQFQYDLLATSRESVKPINQQTLAKELVHKLLSRASTMKLSHGLNNHKLVHLSKIWEQSEKENEDIAPGTYAEFLSWGSIHLEQTREIKPLPVRCGGRRLKASILEVVEDM